MRISHVRIALSVLAGVAASQAHAQLLNISTTGIQSQNTPAVACTIVGTVGSSWRGMKALVVLAEGNSAGSNPRVRAEVLENHEVATNDIWTGPTTFNSTVFAPVPNLYPTLLRAPFGANDAALLLSVPMGWRLCVSSSEESGGDTQRRVTLAVTDVTDRYLQAYGKSADHPAAVKLIPVGTPNVMNTFMRLASQP